MTMRRGKAGPGRARQAGLSLVELMISLILGLLVVAGASAVFLSNKRTYGTSETLNRIQENERVSFEMMSRDVREAGGGPCSSSARRVNHLKSATNTNGWWNASNDGLRGYGGGDALPGTATGSAAGQRLARASDNDAIDVHLANEGDIRVSLHDNPSANVQVTGTTGLNVNDVVMICNSDYQMIFQITQLNSAGGGLSIQHNGGGGGSAGNCSQVFQTFKDVSECDSGASGVGYCFTASTNPNCNETGRSPAQVARLMAARWYLGNNGRGGTSLYRAVVTNNSGTAIPNSVTPTEIAEGATRMNITYLRAGNAAYEAASAITAANAWSQVVAVRIAVTLEGQRGALDGSYIRGTDGNALSRTSSNVVTLRNREPLL